MTADSRPRATACSEDTRERGQQPPTRRERRRADTPHETQDTKEDPGSRPHPPRAAKKRPLDLGGIAAPPNRRKPESTPTQEATASQRATTGHELQPACPPTLERLGFDPAMTVSAKPSDGVASVAAPTSNRRSTACHRSQTPAHAAQVRSALVGAAARPASLHRPTPRHQHRVIRVHLTSPQHAGRRHRQDRARWRLFDHLQPRPMQSATSLPGPSTPSPQRSQRMRDRLPIAQNERHTIGGRQHVHKTLHLITRLGPQRQVLGP